MNFDWHIEINDKYRPLVNAIADLDEQIGGKKNEIKQAKNDGKPQLEIDKIKEQKENLEKQRERKWKDQWAVAYELTPYFGAHWKALSSFYFKEEEIELTRGRYVELHIKEGKKQIKEDMEKQKIDTSFEFFRKPKVDISLLLPFSFFLQFTFTLAQPYLCKDDEAFYICDNPIRKDKVFKVPMVSGSTWKGNMRWTARQTENLNPDKPDNDVIKRLFGNEKTEEKNFHRGRLNFYPTFFDQISLEIINPHDRKTKAGTVPIYIESVPEGATGTFSLLYVPFDLMGKPSEEIKQEVADDINIFYDSLKEMMLTYGFSAKKSSGFGIIKEDINGILEMSGKKDKANQIKPEPIKPTPAKKKTYSTFGELLSSIQPTKQANSLTFSSFEKLKGIINQVKAEVMKNAG